MADDLEKLREKYERADAKAIKLSNDYQTKVQEAVAKLKERYHDRVWEANRAAAAAQKDYCDAEAAAALEGRPDAAEVANRLGLPYDAEDSE